tara:strand:+ start:5556 stop:7406 length:1851 start_codon:yes stop_codon:yes gene_type:complete
MEHALNYWPLLLIFAIAWFVPMMLSWLEVSKIPSVIVEIIAGVIVGPYVLDWIGDEPYVEFLYYTGFIFLMFLSGLEIDVNKIAQSLPRKLRKVDFVSNTFLLAVFIYLGTLALSFPFAHLIDYFIPINVIFLVLLLPTEALSIVVPILKSDNELGRKYGQVILMEGAIAMIMSITLISIYSGVVKNGIQYETFLFLIIFVFFFIAYQLGKVVVRVRTFQKLMYALEHAASQIRLRGTVALLLLFTMIAYWLNTELVLGAFVAGILLSVFLNKERSALTFKLDSISYGFFIPIFFIMVGVKLDISSLSNFAESIPFILLLVAAFFIAQTLPALIMTRVFGVRRAIAAGVLLSSRFGLTIAAAQIGLSLEVISPAANAGIVTACIIISFLAPLLYKQLNTGEEESFNIFILGGGNASFLLAERIKLHGIRCLTLVESDEAYTFLETKDIEVRRITDLEKFNEFIHLKTSDQLIILSGSTQYNNKLTKIAKQLNHNKIITLVDEHERDNHQSSNDTQLVNMDDTLASHVENLILRPDSYQAFSENFGMYRIEEIIMGNDDNVNKRVRDLAFPPSGSLIMLRRNKQIFIPHGETHLLAGDIITVIGNTTALEEFRSILE